MIQPEEFTDYTSFIKSINNLKGFTDLKLSLIAAASHRLGSAKVRIIYNPKIALDESLDIYKNEIASKLKDAQARFHNKNHLYDNKNIYVKWMRRYFEILQDCSPSNEQKKLLLEIKELI